MERVVLNWYPCLMRGKRIGNHGLSKGLIILFLQRLILICNGELSLELGQIVLLIETIWVAWIRWHVRLIHKLTIAV